MDPEVQVFLTLYLSQHQLDPGAHSPSLPAGSVWRLVLCRICSNSDTAIGNSQLGEYLPKLGVKAFSSHLLSSRLWAHTHIHAHFATCLGAKSHFTSSHCPPNFWLVLDRKSHDIFIQSRTKARGYKGKSVPLGSCHCIQVRVQSKSSIKSFL